MSNSSRLHGLQPTRLLRPWDFPGKSTGVGCQCLLWQGKLLPSKLETPIDKHWESQLSGAETHKQQSPQESVLSGETWAVTDKLLEAPSGRVWEIKKKKIQGEPVTAEPPFFFYLQILKVNTGGKIPSCFQQGVGKWTIFKYAWAFYFSLILL